MSLLPPPWDEFTTSEPGCKATRVSPPGIIVTSCPSYTEMLAHYELFRTEPQTLSLIKLQQIINPYANDDVRYSPTMDENILLVKATTIDQVKSLYDDFLSADHGEVAVVGDFEPSEVFPLVAKAVEGWHARDRSPESKAPQGRRRGQGRHQHAGQGKREAPGRPDCVDEG